MNIKDLAGKTVLRGIGRWEDDNDREELGIEFTDGTRVYFSATPYTTGSVDVDFVEPDSAICVNPVDTAWACECGTDNDWCDKLCVACGSDRPNTQSEVSE